jgi:hypothetical protein
MDIQRIAKTSSTTGTPTCPQGMSLNIQKTWCSGVGIRYTGAPYATYYCDADADVLNQNHTCTTQIAGTTYNATLQLDYYYCPTGGTLSGSTCQNSGTSYPASITYWCSSGSLSGTSCVGSPTIYYGYTSSSCRNDGGTPVGGGGCQFGGSTTVPANQSISCNSGGYYNNSGSCITSGSNYSASSAYTYVCNSGDTKNGSTCTTPSTPQTYNARSLGNWTCNSGDTYIIGATTNNCEVKGTTSAQPTITFIGTCPVNYQLETTTGDCVAIAFNQVELFADQEIWNCTTRLNGLIVETGVYTYDDTFSLPTLKRVCTKTTNQNGISNGLNGYYFCQITLSTGTIYSFQATLDLTGTSSTSWTYCWYTGDLQDQRDADEADGNEVQFEGLCNYANNYTEFLVCWRALQI